MTGTYLLVATGIVLVAVGAALLVFRERWARAYVREKPASEAALRAAHRYLWIRAVALIALGVAQLAVVSAVSAWG